MINQFKYYAFISYSRKDKLIASYLKKNIEAFAYPKDSVSEDRLPLDEKYISPIFLDRDKLETTSASFTDELYDNLKSSKYLILLCSQESAKSHWCNEELKIFLETHDNNTSLVIPVFLEGISLSEIAVPHMLENLDDYNKRNLPDMRTGPTDSIYQAWEHGLVQIISYMLRISTGMTLAVILEQKRMRILRRTLYVVLPILLASFIFYFLFSAEKDVVKGKDKDLMTIDAAGFGKASSLNKTSLSTGGKASTGSGGANQSGAADAKGLGSGNANAGDGNASAGDGNANAGDSRDSSANANAKSGLDGLSHATQNSDIKTENNVDSKDALSANSGVASRNDSSEVASVGSVLKTFALKMPNGLDIEFVELSQGKVLLGGHPIWELRNELIDKEFSISRLELNQAQYKSLIGDASAIFGVSESFPMENVSWQQAMDFCAKLTEYFHSTNQIAADEIVSLPTEYQWEYAAKSDFPSDENARAWNLSNSEYKLHKVGSKEQNLWGLYDMHGNVSEWCRDSYVIEGASSIKTQKDSDFKIIKGGSFATSFVRASERDSFNKEGKSHQIGFRIVIEKKE